MDWITATDSYPTKTFQVTGSIRKGIWLARTDHYRYYRKMSDLMPMTLAEVTGTDVWDQYRTGSIWRRNLLPEKFGTRLHDTRDVNPWHWP